MNLSQLLCTPPLATGELFPAHILQLTVAPPYVVNNITLLMLSILFM